MSLNQKIITEQITIKPVNIKGIEIKLSKKKIALLILYSQHTKPIINIETLIEAISGQGLDPTMCHL